MTTALVANGEAGASVRTKINALMSTAFSGATTVDVNKVYGVQPGDDVTTVLQTLLNTLTSGVSLDIVFSVPGTYNINGAQQTGTALGYAYSGSVLIPALAWDGGLATPLRIRGTSPIVAGDAGESGAPSGGVILATTNTTPGAYQFAAVPYSSKFGGQWTGIMPIFEDLIFSHPVDPQGGAVNAESCLHARFKRVVCTPGGGAVSSMPTGSTEAIILPGTKSNGDVALRDVQIRGWGAGVRLSEHAVLDNVEIAFTKSAFTFYSGGHSNWFGYVDIEECQTIFDIKGTSALVIYGHLDVENAVSQFQPTAFAKFSSNLAGIKGAIDMFIDPSGGLGITGPTGAAGTIQVDFRNLALPRKYTHPVDTFERLLGVALPAGSAPGLTWPTLDVWRVTSGGFKLSAAAELQNSNAGSSSAFLPARDGLVGGCSRRVRCVFTTPSGSYDLSIAGNRQGSGTLAAWVRATGGNVTFGIGSLPGGGLIKTFAGAVTNSTSYTVDIDLFIVGGVLKRVDVSLSGTLLYSHPCTSAQQIIGVSPDPYLMDGIYSLDQNTKITAFQVVPLEAPAAVSSGTATLVAGTVAVPLTSITASSIVRLNRQAAGGILGELSVSLSAGVGFTINSNSNIDTSAVFWELVSV